MRHRQICSKFAVEIFLNKISQLDVLKKKVIEIGKCQLILLEPITQLLFWLA